MVPVFYLVRALGSLLPFLVAAAVLVTIAGRFKRMRTNSSASPVKPAANFANKGRKDPEAESFKGYGNFKTGFPSAKMQILSDVLKDDRENDWLARQIREENRIAKRSDMTGAGAELGKLRPADLSGSYRVVESSGKGEYH